MSIEVREPFPEWAWPMVWQWMAPFKNRVSDDFSPKTLAEYVDYSIRGAAVSRTWGVWRDGELGGVVTFQQANPVCGFVHVTFKKSFWGSRTTVEAIRKIFAQIFESGTLKIWGLVFEDNHAIRSLLRRIGGREEGTLRNHTMRDGRPVNMVVLAIEKGEMNATSTTSTAANRRRNGGGRTRRITRLEDRSNQPESEFLRLEQVFAGADVPAGTTAVTDGPV